LSPYPISYPAVWEGVWHDSSDGRIEIWTRVVDPSKVIWKTLVINLYGRPGFENEWDRVGECVWNEKWTPPMGYWRNNMSFRTGDGWGTEVSSSGWGDPVND
jgi:hypothetical protein